jgi:hypothetical protein
LAHGGETWFESLTPLGGMVHLSHYPSSFHRNLMRPAATPRPFLPLDTQEAFNHETFGFYVRDPGRPGLNAQEIKQRKENQQDRIAQGVKSGQLTAGETAKLETKEARLNHEIRADRKANGGNLTNKEKKQINRQQNKLSRQIYRDKHNARQQ